MNSPFGIGTGIASMAGGVTQGLVEAERENRLWDTQDRAYGIQQADQAIRQKTFEQQVEDRDRARKAYLADLYAQTVNPTQGAASVPSDLPPIDLPEGHPDLPPDAGTTGAGPVNPVGIVPPVSVAGPAFGKSTEPVKGLGLAQATGKTNNIGNYDVMRKQSQGLLQQANDINATIHGELDKSGLDPASEEWQLKKVALERHLGPKRDAAFKAGTDLAHAADSAEVSHNGQQFVTYLEGARAAIKAGDTAKFNHYVALAEPYAKAFSPDAQAAGLYRDPAFLKGLSSERLTAMFDPSSSLPERLSAMKNQDAYDQESVQKELDRQSREREARTHAAAAARPWNTEERIAELSRIPPTQQTPDQKSELAALVNLKRSNALAQGLADDKGLQSVRADVIKLQAIGQNPMASEDDKAQAQAQRMSLIQQLNAQGDYSMGIAQYVPGQAGKHFWNGDTPGQWTTTPPAQGLTPPVLGTGGSGVTAPTPNPVAPPRGIVQPTTKAIPPAVQAKVDALRARKVPEVQITEALKKMGY